MNLWPYFWLAFGLVFAVLAILSLSKVIYHEEERKHSTILGGGAIIAICGGIVGWVLRGVM